TQYLRAVAARDIVGDDRVRTILLLGEQVCDPVVGRGPDGHFDPAARGLVVDEGPVAAFAGAEVELAHVVGIGTKCKAHDTGVVAHETGIPYGSPRHRVPNAAVDVHLLHARVWIAGKRADGHEDMLVVVAQAVDQERGHAFGLLGADARPQVPGDALADQHLGPAAIGIHGEQFAGRLWLVQVPEFLRRRDQHPVLADPLEAVDGRVPP